MKGAESPCPPGQPCHWWFIQDRGLLVVAAILALVTLISWLALGKIKAQIRSDINEQLEIVLHTSHEALQLWLHDRLDDAQALARRPDVRLLVRELLDGSQNREALLANGAQQQLRAIGTPWLEHHKDQGMFIIAPNRHNIASTHEENVGRYNVINGHGDYLDHIFSGKSQVVLPVASEVALPSMGGKQARNVATMFFGVPIFADDGRVLAAFALRIDPALNFSRIIQLVAGSGESDDAYAFNQDGQLISGVRFCDEIRTLGLVSPEKRAILNLDLRDPGGNMMVGFRPTTPRSQLPFTLAVEQGRSGQAGLNVEGYRDYRGVPVVGGWLWNEEHNFGLVYEIGIADAYMTYHLIRNTVIAVLLVTITLFLGLSFVLARRRQQSEASNRQLAAEMGERKQSEEKFRVLLESSPDGLLIVNRNGEITLANRQAERLFGYDRQELQGQQVEILIPGHLVKGHDNKRLAFFANPHIRPMGVGLDLYGRHRDGHEFAVEVGLSPVRSQGEMAAIASIRDITKRKEAEEALRSSEEKFRLAMEATADGLWDWDMVSDHVYYSPSWCRMIGYEPHEARPELEFWHSRIHDQDRPAILAMLEDHLDGTLPFFEAEHRLRTKDNQWQWVRGRGRIVTYGPEGVALRMVGTMTDISAQKRVEEELRLHRENLEGLVEERTRALRENEEKLQSITSSAQIAIIMLDNSGNISFWNEAAEKTFGWKAPEVLGKDLHQIIMPAQYSEAQAQAFSTFQKTGEGRCIGQTMELTALRKNGQEFPVELAMSAVRVQGTWHAIGLVTDISERKEAEEEIRHHMEEMERFSRLAVGREEQMIKLKVEINGLLGKLGQVERYKIVG